jgi:glutathione synthase
MEQKHLFILDPMARLNFALDSSLQMALALKAKGHRVFQTESQLLTWQKKEPSARAKACEMTFPQATAASVRLGTPEPMLLSDFHGIHMRKEPPFNMDYIATTWLLDSAANSSWIFNDPAALRSVNEKLSVFLFPKASNAAIVSSNYSDLMDFYKDTADRDAIVKPLDLFGGRGIFRLNRHSEEDAQALDDLREATENGTVPRLMQRFDPRIFEGEVRVFTLGGKAISWCLKIPAPGNFLANTARGAVLRQYTPSLALKEMIESVADELCHQGIFLAGFDVIGEKVSEINVTSPRLLRGEGDDRNYYEEIAHWLIAKCQTSPRSKG